MTLPTPTVELSYVVHYGYIALFLILAVSELTSVLPIGILLIAVGAVTRSHVLDFSTALVVTTAASAFSDMVIFYVSRHLGKRESYRRFVEKSEFASRIEGYAKHHPKATVFFSRLIGFASTPVNAIAGLSQMSPLIFFVFDVLGVGLCCFAYLGAGYLIGAAWQHDAKITAAGIGVALTIAGIAYVLSLYLRSRRKRTMKHTDHA